MEMKYEQCYVTLPEAKKHASNKVGVWWDVQWKKTGNMIWTWIYWGKLNHPISIKVNHIDMHELYSIQ